MAGKEDIYKALGGLEDKLTELSYRIWKPVFDKRTEVDMVLTKTPEERLQFLTELFVRIREQGEVATILFATGGDDGELDQFASALMR